MESSLNAMTQYKQLVNIPK